MQYHDLILDLQLNLGLEASAWAVQQLFTRQLVLLSANMEMEILTL